MSPLADEGFSLGGLITAYLIPLGEVKISGAALAELIAADEETIKAAVDANVLHKNFRLEEADAVVSAFIEKADAWATTRRATPKEAKRQRIMNLVQLAVGKEKI
jgi:hypothetical protein